MSHSLHLMDHRLKGLYGITSQDMLLDNALLFQQVEQALKGGMSILQYRNKHSPRYQSINDLKRLKQLCSDYDALFIINDNIELCLEIGADGVHLGKDDGELQNVKKILGQDAIIGVSCYNELRLAKNAREQGASYVAFGAFYTSPTKPNAPTASLSLVAQAKSLNIPVCCIGGITIYNAKPLVNHGTHMLAVISQLFNSGDVQTNAEKLSCLL